MFAFGTAVYYIVTVKSPFPGLDTTDDEVKINRQFQNANFLA